MQISPPLFPTDQRAGLLEKKQQPIGINRGGPANEPWSSCALIGSPSTHNQNCARYTRAEITQNSCCLEGTKLLMRRADCQRCGSLLLFPSPATGSEVPATVLMNPCDLVATARLMLPGGLFFFHSSFLKHKFKKNVFCIVVVRFKTGTRKRPVKCFIGVH